MSRILFVIFAMTCLSSYGYQRQQKMDSLKYQIREAQNDSTKVYAIIRLSQSYSSYDLKSSIIEAEKALDIANENKSKNLMAFAMFNAGNAYFNQGMFETATNYYYSYLNAMGLY